MKIGPKYKIARRLGAPVFEKTQNQKFSLSLESRKRPTGRVKPKSEYGIQMLEKQKARYYYLLSEKQFSNYVHEALASQGGNVPTLYEFLEMRLDNAVLRLGFASTRAAARQMVSHGHILVNGRRVTVPSLRLRVGDTISIRPGSAGKALFAVLDERLKNVTIPSWLTLDYGTKNASVQGKPQVQNATLLFDLNSVFEFYSR